MRGVVPLPKWEFTVSLSYSFDFEDDQAYDDLGHVELEALTRERPDDLRAHLALARSRANQHASLARSAAYADVDRRARALLDADPEHLEALRTLTRVAMATDDYELGRQLAHRVLRHPEVEPWDHIRWSFMALDQVIELLGVSEAELLDIFAAGLLKTDPKTPKRAAELLADMTLGLDAARAGLRLGGDERLAAAIALGRLFHAGILARTCARGDTSGRMKARRDLLAAYREAGQAMQRARPDHPDPILVRASAVLAEFLDGYTGEKGPVIGPWRIPAEARLSLAPMLAELHALAGGRGELPSQAARYVAWLHLVLGETDHAEMFAKRAVEGSTADGSGWRILCILLGMNERHEELEAAARHWLRAEGTLDGRWALTKALAGQGKTAAALSEARHILASDPASPECHLLVAALQLRLDGDEESLGRIRDQLSVVRELLLDAEEDNPDARVCLVHLSAVELALSGDSGEALLRLRLLEHRGEADDDTVALRAAISVGGAPVIHPAAWVDDVPIHREELLRHVGIWLFLLQAGELEVSIRDVLDGLVRARLLVRLAEQDDIRVTEAEVDGLVAAHLARAALCSEDEAARFLDPETAENAALELTACDAQTLRDRLRQTATATRWSWMQLRRTTVVETETGRAVFPPRHIRALYEDRPDLWGRSRAFRGALWKLAEASAHGGDPNADDPDADGERHEIHLLRLLRDTPDEIDGRSVAALLGVEDGSWLEFDSLAGQPLALPDELPDVAAWLGADERRAGDVRAFTEPSGRWLAAIFEVQPAGILPFDQGWPLVGERLLRDAMAKIHLDALVRELVVPGRVRPPEVADWLLAEVRSELEALDPACTRLFSRESPQQASETTVLPLAVFSNLTAALAEAATCECTLFLLVEPGPVEKRSVSDETLSALARNHVVVVVSGEAGDLEGDRVRSRYGLSEGERHALALAPDGSLLRADLPLDRAALLEAMQEVAARR